VGRVQIKIWNSGYPKEPEKGWCTITKNRSAIQNDDADQQTPGSTSRDMGSDGCVLIKDCSSADEHRQFEVELFSSPPGADDNDNDYPIRMLLSSYWWFNNSFGVPDGKSDCALCTVTCQGCQGVPLMAAYSASSQGYDAQPGYTRTHRDATVIGAMRAWMHLP
jgi:alpha-amylase